MFDFLDIDGALADVFRAVALFVPKFAVFAAILVVGWLVARLARKLCVTVLARIGFPRIVERSGLNRFLSRGATDGTGDALAARADLDPTLLIARLVYCAVLLFAAQLAFAVWGPNPISALIGDVIGWLPRAAVAIVIVAVAAALAQGAYRALVALLGGTAYARPVAGMARLLIVGLGIVAALNQIGVAESVTTPLLIAVLATVAGVVIVGAGGGLIRPMQHRWERILINVEAQARSVSTSAQVAAYLAGHTDTAAAPLATQQHEAPHHAMSPADAMNATHAMSAAHATGAGAGLVVGARHVMNATDGSGAQPMNAGHAMNADSMNAGHAMNADPMNAGHATSGHPSTAPDAMTTPSAAHQTLPGGWPTLHATRPEHPSGPAPHGSTAPHA
jgi:hypothetical protein